ncbi:MAG: hypothetical protein Q4D66_07170 [Bacteroidales bacterium]|nr:hypothetical protein [Bacteroidales bacterium]
MTVSGNGYTFQNLGNKKYLPIPQTSVETDAQDNAVPLSVIPVGIPGKIAFGGNSQYTYYHADGYAKAVGWESNSGPSQWEIEKVESPEATISNDFQGYATFAAPFATTIPQGIEVFTAQKSGNQLMLNKVEENVLPANTAVIIKGTPNTTHTFTKSEEEGTALNNNILVASLTPFAPASSTYTLQNNGEGVCFYPYNGEKVVAFKAYFTNGTTAGTKGFTFGNVLTGIDKVQPTGTSSEKIFDLQGRRVRQAQSGLYIVNGKKTLIK